MCWCLVVLQRTCSTNELLHIETYCVVHCACMYCAAINQFYSLTYTNFDSQILIVVVQKGNTINAGDYTLVPKWSLTLTLECVTMLIYNTVRRLTVMLLLSHFKTRLSQQTCLARHRLADIVVNRLSAVKRKTKVDAFVSRTQGLRADARL